MTNVPNLRAAKAEVTSYIADKIRYISITEQQGPLREGETRIGAQRRYYIKQKLEWDTENALWGHKDGRPIVTKDQIWDTVISEIRQLGLYGQKLVWTTIKAKFDGILEDDIRKICQLWFDHKLSQLDRDNESHWSLSGDTVEPANALRAHSPTETSQSDQPSRDDDAPPVVESPHVQGPPRETQKTEEDSGFFLRQFKTNASNLPTTLQFAKRLREMMRDHSPRVPPPNMILYAALKEARRNGNADARRTEPYIKWQLREVHELEEDDDEDEDDEDEDDTNGEEEQEDGEEQEAEEAEEEEEEGSAAEGSIEL